MRNSRIKIRRLRRKGFTLAEVMLAAALLAIATAGTVLPFASGAGVQAEGIHRTVAAGLADDLMQKISNTSFSDIVSTYGSYSEAECQVKNAAGVVIDDDGYKLFSRSASCEYVYLSQQSRTSDACFVLATVQVSYDDKTMIVLKKLISK